MDQRLPVCVSALFFCIFSSACGGCGKNSGPTSSVGFGDLKQSCEARATWQNRSARKCTDCFAAAASPSCNCEEFKDFGGMCLTQDQAKHADSTCTLEMDACAKSCAPSDCNCYANCYEASPSCKTAAAAREGCLTAVCGPYCK